MGTELSPVPDVSGQPEQRTNQRSTMSQPQQFRKKPVVIEAMRTGTNHQISGAVTTWINGNGGDAHERHDPDHGGYVIDIVTLEGTMTATGGDWVIRGVKGEFYPCKPDIFEATYESADG